MKFKGSSVGVWWEFFLLIGLFVWVAFCFMAPICWLLVRSSRPPKMTMTRTTGTILARGAEA